jgi:molybdenum cofactor cytidylyltransferase
MTSPIPVIILAAGESKRMGFPKALINWQGELMIERMLRAARSQSDKVLIVSGKHHAEIAEIVKAPNQLLYNPNWQTGMAESIKAGLSHCIQEWDPVAVLIMVCDQPYVDEKIIYTLMEGHRAKPDTPICATYANTFGVPAIFPKLYFPMLMQLSGDRGAKSIIQKDPNVLGVTFPKGEIDLDSPEDLKNL